MNDAATRVDVLVIGAGPAGLAAACLAAEAGKTVAVLDHAPWSGGQIWRGEAERPTLPLARRWLPRLAQSGARVFHGTSAVAAPGNKIVLAETPAGAAQFNWDKLILATGARELFLPFPGWTFPGVMGPGGVHAMAKAGWPVAGKRIVVAGTGPLLLAVASGLRQHGARIVCVAEQAPMTAVARFGFGLLRHPGKLRQGLGVKAGLLGVPYRCGVWPVRADGEGVVQRVTLTDGRRSWTETCDCLAVGFHLVPNLEWPQLLGCAVDHGRVAVDEWQATTVPGVFCAGEPTGVGGADCALVEGQIAGLAAAGQAEAARALFAERARWHRFRKSLGRAFALRPEVRRLADAETIVCRCEDVRHGELAACDGWRAAKLHTRCGMGPCQGRTCGGAVRELFGWEMESVRPPVFPAAVASLMGGGSATAADESRR